MYMFNVFLFTAMPAQKLPQARCFGKRGAIRLAARTVCVCVHIYIYICICIYAYILLSDRLLSTGRLATPARPITYLYHN